MRRLLLLLALPWLGSCGGIPVAAERGPPATAWHYDFVVDDGLTRLDATVCFEGETPWALGPIDADGRRYLRSAVALSSVTDAEPLELGMSGNAIDTRNLPPDTCVRYVVDLDAAARQRGGLHGAYRIGSDLVASTAVWLWAPRYRDPEARVTASFTLPPEVSISPLWTLLPDGRRRLDERAFRFTAYVAFGRFVTRHVGVAGACMRVSVLGRGVEMGDAAVARSLTESATAASLLFGRFPVREVGVLAVPTPFSESSPFGLVGRGTMPTVAILVGERATEERLTRAWVPVHEFSHLATPFIEREHAWLSEGIATYYQEILRARAGLETEETAFRNLDAGFELGRRHGTGRTLAAESRDMRQTASFRRVYWAGAAIAMIADVEIRTRSDGARSLDDALEHLSECCGARGETMSGAEAMSILDEIEPNAFRPIAQRYLGTSAFPDLSPTYERLGLVRRSDGALYIEESGPGADLRRRILQSPRELEPPPDCAPR